MTNNPLTKYTTRPGVFVKLPSAGKYYPDPPRLSADGELEVLPMTAMDELNLKNPDGLMNSESLFKVIEHVAPGVRDARYIPTPDLDSIIIGMRLATYGDKMNVGAKCEKCKHDEEYEVNLHQVLASTQMITAPDQIQVGALKVNIRPHTAESNAMLSNYQSELLRAARQLEHASDGKEEAYQKQFSDAVKRGSDILFEIATNHIIDVKTPDDEVITDRNIISEWLAGLTSPDYQIIRDGVIKLSEERIDRNLSFQCLECNHVTKVEVTFDPANFFGTSSL